MKQAYLVAAAAFAIAGVGITSSARAECDPANPASCTPPAAQATKGPLALHPTKLGSARRSVSRSGRHHTARTASAHKTAAKPAADTVAKAATKTATKPAPDAAVAAAAPDTSPVQPRMVATVPFAAAPVALPSTTSGFATTQQPWSTVSAFASPDAPTASARTWAATLPVGRDPAFAHSSNVKIVPSDQLNAIDLAADKPIAGKPDQVADASGTASQTADANGTPASKESWGGWLYRICSGTLSAATSAVKAVLM